jgi:hypothetical protein
VYGAHEGKLVLLHLTYIDKKLALIQMNAHLGRGIPPLPMNASSTQISIFENYLIVYDMTPETFNMYNIEEQVWIESTQDIISSSINGTSNSHDHRASASAFPIFLTIIFVLETILLLSIAFVYQFKRKKRHNSEALEKFNEEAKLLNNQRVSYCIRLCDRMSTQKKIK